MKSHVGDRAVGAGRAPSARRRALAIAAAPAIADDVADLRADVERLAAPELGGRLTGTEGERRAADFLAGELRAIGAQPLAGEDDFLVPFEFTAGALDRGSSLRLEGDAPVDWTADGKSGERKVQALSFSDQGKVSGDVVFAGYGIKVPEGKDLSYDSFFGLDLRGKIALVLRYFPEDTDSELRSALSRYSGLRYKAMHAREAGAVGLLVVAGPRSPNAGELVPMTFDTAIAGSGIVAASITRRRGAAVVRRRRTHPRRRAGGARHRQPARHGLRARRRARDARRRDRARAAGRSQRGRCAAGASGSVRRRAPLAPDRRALRPSRRGRSEQLAGAQGRGRRRCTVARTTTRPASRPRSLPPQRLAASPGDRGVVVAFWSGEELGLLGSTDFVRKPVVAPDSLAACLNFDMVGRARDNKLVVQGVGSSPAWRGLVEQANVPVGFDLQLQDDPQLPTDSASFDRAGVPCLNFFTGGHEDYHRPSDTPEKLNYEDMERVVDLAANVGTPTDHRSPSRSSSPRSSPRSSAAPRPTRCAPSPAPFPTTPPRSRG